MVSGNNVFTILCNKSNSLVYYCCNMRYSGRHNARIA